MAIAATHTHTYTLTYNVQNEIIWSLTSVKLTKESIQDTVDRMATTNSLNQWSPTMRANKNPKNQTNSLITRIVATSVMVWLRTSFHFVSFYFFYQFGKSNYAYRVHAPNTLYEVRWIASHITHHTLLCLNLCVCRHSHRTNINKNNNYLSIAIERCKNNTFVRLT